MSQSPPKCSHPSFSHYCYANADMKKKGVMIAIKDSVAFKFHSVVMDPQGRFLILICDINSATYTVANVYAPNRGQIRFFNRVMKKIRSVERGCLLLCGDFNITPDPSVDSTATHKRTPPSLGDSLRSHELFDAWRCLTQMRETIPFSQTATGPTAGLIYFW